MGSNEVVIGFSDLRRLFFRVLPQMKRIAIFSGLAVFLFLVFKVPQFESSALVKSTPNSTHRMKQLHELLPIVCLSEKERETPLAALNARRLQSLVVEELGLQVSVDSESIVSRLARRVYCNLLPKKAAYAQLGRRFEFRDVSYPKNEPFFFYIKPISDSDFQLLDRSKNFLIQGKLNERFSVQGFEGRLLSFPDHVKLNNFYFGQVNSFLQTMNQVHSTLTAKRFQLSNEVFDVRFTHSSPELSSEVVNRLIDHYVSSLKILKKQEVQEFLAYLQQREQDLLGQGAKIVDADEVVRASIVEERVSTLEKEKLKHLIQSISEVIEVEKIDLQFEHYGPRAISVAYPPLQSKSFWPPSYALLAAIMGGGVIYFFHFFKYLRKGFPVTHQTLKASGFNSFLYQTPDSSSCLRQIIYFLSELTNNKGRCCGIVGESSAEFSRGLASLMRLEGLKVLIIECSGNGESSPGLWEYLQGKVDQLPVHAISDDGTPYAHVSSGEKPEHGVELLRASRFSDWLGQMKSQYDRILVSTNASPKSMEGVTLLQVVDSVVVLADEETREDLKIYQFSSDQKKRENVAVVCCEGY